MRFPCAFPLLLAAIPCGLASANPAARAGAMTTHAGVVTAGSANVVIGGFPAARQGDFASCPLFEGLVPHVGGPIIGGSVTVFINGMPAARMGDAIVEAAGPGSAIAGGHPTVLIGSGASTLSGPAARAAPLR
jgi:uncharacterized Zn-binding protein involved in type VI secretion